MAERVLRVVFAGDASGAVNASRQVQGGLTSTQSKFSKFKTGAMVAFRGAAVGATALAAGVGYVVKQAAEAQKVQAQTNAVIKSTGGEANVSAEHVAKLAGAIRDYSGIADDTVAAGQNMLLTFTNIRNETGKGNKIFDQATRVLADMSTALGSDMKSQAIQLGKALNDPVRGITALTRVGVTFTDKQRTVIERLTQTGRRAEAQRLILKELRKEFGGSARAAGETLAGKLNILKDKLGDVAEKVGNALLPIISRLVDWLTDNLPKAIKEMRPILNALGGWFKSVGGGIKVLAGFLGQVLGLLADVAGAVARLNEMMDNRLFDALQSGLPGIGAIKSIGGLFGGGRASGGPVIPGKAYIVGERGPEVFSTSRAGHITPNHQLSSPQVVVSIDGRQIQTATHRRQVLLGGA